jgi:hypothetical protein
MIQAGSPMLQSCSSIFQPRQQMPRSPGLINGMTHICPQPGIEFWDGSGDSSDELLDEAREFDAPSSEGSVDYPSTPEADAYVREVVSGDDAANGGGDDYAFGNEQFDSDDGDSNKAMCRPSPSTLFGYRRHGSDDDTLSMPEVNGLEQGDEGDSCPSD